MTLAAQDNGSRHLTQGYKGMGFAEVGVNNRGFPQLEAPIGRVLAGVARGSVRPVSDYASQRINPIPNQRKDGNPLQATLAARPQQLIQRADTVSAANFTFTIKHGRGNVFDADTKTLVKEHGSAEETIHHKISHAHLKRLTRVLEAAVKSTERSVTAATTTLLNTLYRYMGRSTKSTFDLLNNMSLNLTYGPTSRWRHMGDIFDPNADLSSGEDTTSDISGKEEKAARRPKLYRRLSARSSQLSEIDGLIVKMPVGLADIRTYVKKPEAAADILKINTALAAAIAADAQLVGNATRFYDKRHWQSVEDKYTRATTKSVFDAYDPKLGSSISIYEATRNNRLENLKLQWKVRKGIQIDLDLSDLIKKLDRQSGW